MPLHDYDCPHCGHEELDVYRSILFRASESAPTCRYCEYPMEWRPQVGRIDASSGPSFKSFQMQQRQPDGSFKEITLSSVADLRRIER